MFGFVKLLFTSAEPTTVLPDGNIKHGELDAPRYPPTDRGLPLVSVEDVIESQREIVNRIQRTAGLTPENYAQLIEPLIVNFARYVLLLPATNTMNHRGAGGLFRMGLELGLFSLQVASSTSFTSKGSTSAESRFRNHPKWVFATFVAAICSEIYRPISNMVVVDSEGNKWPQLLMPLHDWMVSNKKTRYYVIWNAQNEDEIGFQQANAAFLLTSIVPSTSLQYLNDGDNEIMLAMTNCVTGAQGGNTQISKIVSSIRGKIVQNDMKTNSERYGMQIVGAHLEPHLLDAMRRLFKEGTWAVNTKGARIWYSERDGLFIVWQAAAREMLKLLEKDGRVGIPQDVDTLADILIACGAAVPTDEGNRFWSIQIPVTMQLLSAIKIALPEIILQNSEISPGDFTLLGKSEVTLAQPSETKKFPVIDQPESSLILTDNKLINTGTGEVFEVSEIQASQSAQEQITNSTPHLSNAIPKETNEASKNLPDGEEVRSNNHSNEQAITPQQKPVSVPKQKPARMQAPTLPQKQIPKVKIPSAVEVSKKTSTTILNPRPAGGLKENITPLGAQAEELFGALKADIREFLQAILEDFLNNRSTGAVFFVPHGVAISTEELNAHGQVNFTGLLQALSNKHWLWEDTENFPNGKKLHEKEHNGQFIKVMIIKAEIARGMGFDWKGAI